MKISKYVILCLSLSFAFVLPSNAASKKSNQTETPYILQDIVFSNLNELHIIGVDNDNDKNLRWAVWNQTSSQSKIVKLALVKNITSGPVVLYTLERKDAYESDIKRISEWRYGKHPVFALTYHYGAAAEQVELFGLDDNNRPMKIDEMLGECIGWSINDGQTVLGVYDKPESRLLPTWYHWEEKTHKLIRTIGKQ
jgi:hypothetical protein